MEDSKLPQSIFGAVISITSMLTSVAAWIKANGPTVISVAGGLVAVIAGLYAIQASRETIKLRRAQRMKIQESDLDTSP